MDLIQPMTFIVTGTNMRLSDIQTGVVLAEGSSVWTVMIPSDCHRREIQHGFLGAQDDWKPHLSDSCVKYWLFDSSGICVALMT